MEKIMKGIFKQYIFTALFVAILVGGVIYLQEGKLTQVYFLLIVSFIIMLSIIAFLVMRYHERVQQMKKYLPYIFMVLGALMILVNTSSLILEGYIMQSGVQMMNVRDIVLGAGMLWYGIYLKRKSEKSKL